MAALDNFKWFTTQTDRNKLEIILIAIVVLLVYGVRLQYNYNNSITNEFKKSDSLYTSRLNNLHSLYQKQLQECNESRIEEQIKQNEFWLEKYEELYEETRKTLKTLNR